MRGNVMNLDSYEEDLLSEGTYEGEIIKAEIADTSKGGQMLKLEAIVQDGPDTEQGESPVGQRLFPTFPHPHESHKDRGRYAGIQLRKACEAAGVVIDETGYDSEDFVGSVVKLVVKHEEYEGAPRARVTRMLPV